MWREVERKKQCVLKYLRGLTGLVSVGLPGPASRFGNAKSSLLNVLAGSLPVPQVGVKGTPSLTVKMVPSSQPSVSHLAGPEKDFAVGMSQVPLMTSLRLTLKSDGARVNLKSNHFRLEME